MPSIVASARRIMVFSSRGAHSGVSAPSSPYVNSVNNEGCDEITIPFSERRSFVNAKVVGIQYCIEKEICCLYLVRLFSLV